MSNNFDETLPCEGAPILKEKERSRGGALRLQKIEYSSYWTKIRAHPSNKQITPFPERVSLRLLDCDPYE